MKVKWYPIILFLLCIWLLTGCCAHEQWIDAACLTPKTCAECGKSKGEPLGHTWQEADCITPRTCTLCGITEGEHLDHDWQEATCQTPLLCRRCDLTIGSVTDHCFTHEDGSNSPVCIFCSTPRCPTPDDHYWIPANCIAPETCYYCQETRGTVADRHSWIMRTTENPFICADCGKREGEPIQTDPRFLTEESKQVFGCWMAPLVVPSSQISSHLGLNTGYSASEIPLTFYASFMHDGTMELFIMPDESITAAAQLENIKQMVQTIYEEYAGKGLSKEAADQEYRKLYGKTVSEYVKHIYRSDILVWVANGVYYVEDGILHLGLDWDQPMLELPLQITDDDTISLEGNILAIPADKAHTASIGFVGPHRMGSGFTVDIELNNPQLVLCNDPR